MSAILLVTNAFFVALFVLYLNYYYGNWKKQHKLVTIVSFLGWYLPILILFIIPIDISVAYYSKCLAESKQLNSTNSTFAKNCHSPWLFIDKEILLVFWHITYWTTFCMTWMFLPIIQSFAKSGAFDILGKLKSSLIDNAIYYGTYLLIVAFIGIYLLIKHTIPLNLSSIKLLIITASNTWGLFLVILFLGYGLVEVPRNLWYSSDSRKSLNKIYSALPEYNMERLDEEAELNYLIKKSKCWSSKISNVHKFRRYMDIVLDKVEEAEMQMDDKKSKRQTNSYLSQMRGDHDPEYNWNESDIKFKSFVTLHRNIKVHLHRYLRDVALWENTIEEGLKLEDIENNRYSGIRHYRASTNNRYNTNSNCSWFLSKLEWYWKCVMRSIVLKSLSILCICLNALFVWSECTFWIHKPVLSVFAILLEISAEHYNYFTIAMVSFLSIGYLSLCVYSSVFRLKLFNYFQLVPNHHSDENSLIFCGMLLCRLTPPLILNFLGLVHFDSHILISSTSSQTTIEIPVETAYTTFMGHLDLIPLIAKGFNVYFPLLVLVLCLFTWLRIGERIMDYLGLKTLYGCSDLDENVLNNNIQEGKIILKRERQNNNRNHLTEDIRRTDYRSTVIEMGSNDTSIYKADTDKDKLLDHQDHLVSNTDEWAPVEYNESSIQNDFRLASANSNNNNRPQSSFNKPHTFVATNKSAASSSIFKKFWPL